MRVGLELNSGVDRTSGPRGAGMRCSARREVERWVRWIALVALAVMAHELRACRRCVSADCAYVMAISLASCFAAMIATMYHISHHLCSIKRTHCCSLRLL